jgi:hypothetical protein
MALGFLKEAGPAVGDVHVNTADFLAPDKGKRTPEDIENERKANLRTGPEGAVSKEGFIAKVDTSHGLVFGFGIVCRKGGQPYFDLQKDHIPEDSMIEAAADFMKNSRQAHEMHAGSKQGDVVFAMPITDDIRKFIADSDETGLLIGMAPSAEVLAKFKSGEYAGFSIGGERIDDEDGSAGVRRAA